MGIILNNQGELLKPGMGHRYPSIEASIVAWNFKGEAWTVLETERCRSCRSCGILGQGELIARSGTSQRECAVVNKAGRSRETEERFDISYVEREFWDFGVFKTYRNVMGVRFHFHPGCGVWGSSGCPQQATVSSPSRLISLSCRCSLLCPTCPCLSLSSHPFPSFLFLHLQPFTSCFLLFFTKLTSVLLLYSFVLRELFKTSNEIMPPLPH